MIFQTQAGDRLNLKDYESAQELLEELHAIDPALALIAAKHLKVHRREYRRSALFEWLCIGCEMAAIIGLIVGAMWVVTS